MKKRIILFFLWLFIFSGCGKKQNAPIVATTAPVYTFTAELCQGTDLEVAQLITESVSCLHDYTLKVDQVKSAEAAGIVVINGAGLEDFLNGVIPREKVIDASERIPLLWEEDGHHEDEHHHMDGHHHEDDPHIWLDVKNAIAMADNICRGLCNAYPQWQDTFQANNSRLQTRLSALDGYGKEALSGISGKELITFHDGFAYLAEGYGLEILEAIEEESGSEASAKDLIALIGTVRSHNLPAIFTEVNGSPSAASVISRETGCKIYALTMSMQGDYFDNMYYNFDTLKEALK